MEYLPKFYLARCDIMKTIQVIAILIVVLSFALACMAYQALPENVISHWDISGNPNGHSSKVLFVSLFPALSLFFLAIYLILPKIDPNMSAYEGFEHEYGRLFVALLAFMQYIFALSVIFNMGIKLNITQWLAPAFALLFYFIGKIMLAAKQNYFVGFRTPWTLASAPVWDKTNKLAGKMFLAASAVSLTGIFIPEIGMAVSVGIVITTAIVGFFYSYLEFQKEKVILKAGKKHLQQPPESKPLRSGGGTKLKDNFVRCVNCPSAMNYPIYT